MGEREMTRRLPLQPLLDLSQVRDVFTSGGFAEGEHETSRTIAILAERLHVSRRTIWRYLRDGIPEEQADRAACLIGLHPASVWLDWYELEPA